MKQSTIEIDVVGVALATKFAEDSYQSSLSFYEKRGQSNSDKIKEDIKNGRLAELAVFKHYNNIDGCSMDLPDFEIYDGPRKSYEADLVLKANGKKFNVHVKSQHIDQANNYGHSYSFQKNDSLVFNPRINDLVVLCTILSDNSIIVREPVKARDLVGVYGEPKLNRLKHSKKVLYLDDLIKKEKEKKEEKEKKTLLTS